MTLFATLFHLFSSAFITFMLLVALLPDTKSYFGFDIQLYEVKDNPLPNDFSGPLEENDLFSHTKHLFEGQLRGPESFAVWQDKIYTGLLDGRIIEFVNDSSSFRTIAHLDPLNLGLTQCQLLHNIGKCGRPCGIRFDSSGTLFTVDPTHGLYSVNITSGHVELIKSRDQLSDARFLDDLVIFEKENGHKVFYMSDASAEWDIWDANYLVAEHDRTGRLLSYDTETDHVTVEAMGLAFSNGLELTDDRSALLLCSFTDRLVYLYSISPGANRGKLEVLIRNLPGEPDNIKRSANRKRETFWVALFTGRTAQNPHFELDTLNKWPYVKRFLFRIQRLNGWILELLGSLLRSDALMQFGFDFKTALSIGRAMCQHGLAVEVDTNGTIVGSMHSPDGSTCALTEVHEVKLEQNDNNSGRKRRRQFYLGSGSNNYLGQLTIDDDDSSAM